MTSNIFYIVAIATFVSMFKYYAYVTDYYHVGLSLSEIKRVLELIKRSERQILRILHSRGLHSRTGPKVKSRSWQSRSWQSRSRFNKKKYYG